MMCQGDCPTCGRCSTCGRKDTTCQPQWLGCIDGKGHSYPSPWWGTVAPACSKCGQQSLPMYSVTISDGLSNVQPNIVCMA